MNDAVDSIGKLAHALTEAPITDIVAGVGGEPVHSRWIAIDQAMIDRFATLTNDHNWLHVDPERAAKSPVGSTIAQPDEAASIMICFAVEARSCSHSDLPTSVPRAARKVLAMPPPMTRASTFCTRLVSRSILVETLAPPTIAITGRAGLSRPAESASSSACMVRPA